MFTKIYLKNYKSLIELTVDLLKKKNEAKQLVLVYGENGVGKSNFASAFLTLRESLQTMSVRIAIDKFLNDREEKLNMPDDVFVEMVTKKMRDTESIIKNCKTINEPGNMVLEFEFVLGDKNGLYRLEYDNSRIVREKLDYVLSKNKTNVFDITTESIKINKNMFTDSEYEKEIKLLIKKYFGKHTVLSMLVHEKEENAEGYVRERVNNGIFDVLSFFMTMSTKVKTGNRGERGSMGVSHEILANLECGDIDISEQEELEKAENVVNEFFTLAYADIKEAYYKTEIIDEKINYELYFKKLIYGKIIDVSYAAESTGTLQLLTVLPFLLMCVEGTTVVIDELDTGIHDLLINNILTNIISALEGQLIVTTHNTMLLDSEIDPSCIYTFMVDRDANKTLEPITVYEDRTHPNLNYRARYLKGMYGGTPISRDIDFEELHDLLD